MNQTISAAPRAVVTAASAAAMLAWATARACLICSSPASPRVLSFNDDSEVSEANLLILSPPKILIIVLAVRNRIKDQN